MGRLGMRWRTICRCVMGRGVGAGDGAGVRRRWSGGPGGEGLAWPGLGHRRGMRLMDLSCCGRSRSWHRLTKQTLNRPLDPLAVSPKPPISQLTNCLGLRRLCYNITCNLNG